jgi:type I restriction enzyme R subunit
VEALYSDTDTRHQFQIAAQQVVTRYRALPFEAAAPFAERRDNLETILRYQEIIAAYNREKDRATVEETFARLLAFVKTLDAEQQRAVAEGLSEDEQALFDLLKKETLSKRERERLKRASRQLLASIRALLTSMPHWTANTQTQAEVEVAIRDHLVELLPIPPYTPQDTEAAYLRVYEYVWGRSAAGDLFAAAA